VMTLAAGVVFLLDAIIRRLPLPAMARRPVAAALLVVALIAPAIGLHSYAHEPMQRSFRDMVRYVERLGEPGEFVYFTSGLDQTEFRYYLSPQSTLFPRQTIWQEIADGPYPRRGGMPFWFVISRVQTHSRDEMEWALNNLTHTAFEDTYLFYSHKHVDMNLGGGLLEQMRYTPAPATVPEAVRGFDAFYVAPFIPRHGDYFLSLSTARAMCYLWLEDFRPPRLAPLTTDVAAEASKVWLAEGRHIATLFAPRGAFDPKGELRLRFLPAVGDAYAVNPAQFDFTRGYWTFDWPTVHQGRFGMGMSQWGILCYPVVVERAGPHEFALTADNDRPASNVIQFWVDKTALRTFVFDKRDNSLETQRAVLNLTKGFHLITLRNLWYPGVDEIRKGTVPDRNKRTFLANVALRPVSLDEARRLLSQGSEKSKVKSEK